MLYFFSTIFGLVMLTLALKSGRDNGYPYLGDIDLNNDEEND